MCEINTSIFRKAMVEVGFNPDSFLSWAKKNGTIKTAQGRNTATTKINGTTTRVVVLKLGVNFDEEPQKEQFVTVADPDFPL